MTDVRVAHRYAKALLASARERGVMNEVERDLVDLREVWERNPGLARFLENPEVGLEEKRQFLNRVFPPPLLALVRRFVDFLLEKKRIESFVEVVSEFSRLVEEERGRLEAQVSTRVPLTDEQRVRLAQSLSRLVGKDVRLAENIDPGVIGGLRVSMQDRVVDRTIRFQLVQLRESLLAARLLES